MTHVLVINSGSSSIKYEVFDVPGERSLVKGEIEHLDAASATSGARPLAGYDRALDQILAAAGSTRIDAIGHRVVHGGTAFAAPTLIDDEVVAAIDRLSELAPLHNPPSLAGIRATRRLLPHVPQVAVFDTAFHRTMPPVASTYALPPALTQRLGIRRYGFHGTNCAWCVSEVARHYARPEASLNLIVAHLGAGASVTAIRAGRSVDTSMGMSPLEGVMMQTRSGDIDPAIVLLLARSGMSTDEIDRLLNRQSGALAIGGDADMRTLAERSGSGDAGAAFAREMYAYRVQKYVGGYAGVVWPLDAIVFTGGIGENDAALRGMICSPLAYLGVALDPTRNAAPQGAPVSRLSAAGATVDVVVVRAGEEREIARETIAVIGAGAGDRAPPGAHEA